MLDSLVPVDFFIISTSRIAHCMPGAVKLFQPGNPDFSQLKDFFLKKKKKKKERKTPRHFSNHCSTMPEFVLLKSHLFL